MKEVITKTLEEKKNLESDFHNDFDVCKTIFLSNPIVLRLWASFFVILPIFVQAPWVRFQPLSALCFTFIIIFFAFLLSRNEFKKWFIAYSCDLRNE